MERPRRRRLVRCLLATTPVISIGIAVIFAATGRSPQLRLAPGWKIELVAQSPEILFPTAIVAAPDGTIYLGQDPMDMPGPPTTPIDSSWRSRTARSRSFADKLWSVMGLEWVDGALYVVHAPYLSAFRDTDGDGKADQRVDLMTGLGPEVPGFNGINDHVASGVRLGMDGFLYISVGDKGIPAASAQDGTTIQFYGGGVIRIRPDGTGLEIVSTGERNPLSVALSATDEIFTYGNDDDSKKWPNSLTHHIVGGHYGYPYQFLTAPGRALPIMGGQIGGVGAQGICYNEDGLPGEYPRQPVLLRLGLAEPSSDARSSGRGHVRGQVDGGHRDQGGPRRLPALLAGRRCRRRRSLCLVDWAYNGWLVDGPQTGRLFRLSYSGRDAARPSPRPTGDALADRLACARTPRPLRALAARRPRHAQGPSRNAR